MNDLVSYFYQMKWPDGFRCPRCSHTSAYTIRSRRLPLYQCHLCRHQTSLTAGTIMEGSRTPLEHWATALHHLSQHNSINAVQLSEQIKVTYKTAWLMLRKIRAAIHTIDHKQPLTGSVNAGLRFYGRNYQPYIPHPKEHPVIVAATCLNNHEISHVKMKPVPAQQMQNKRLIHNGEAPFRDRHLHRNARLSLYNRVQFRNYYELNAMFHQAVLWINRTFHGIGFKYLESYFDEYCFRINAALRKRDVLDTLVSLCVHRQAKVGSQLQQAA